MPRRGAVRQRISLITERLNLWRRAQTTQEADLVGILEQMGDYVEYLRIQQNSAWGMGLTDTPPPLYSPWSPTSPTQ